LTRQTEKVGDVTIDVPPSFITGVGGTFEARIIFDRLLVCKLTNEALDEVRRMEQAENRNLKKTRLLNGILEGLNSLFKATSAKTRRLRIIRNAHHGILPHSR